MTRLYYAAPPDSPGPSRSRSALWIVGFIPLSIAAYLFAYWLFVPLLILVAVFALIFVPARALWRHRRRR